MSAAIALAEVRAAGVSVRLKGNVLKLRGRPEAVSVAKVRLKPYKAEIIRHLLSQFQLDRCHDDPELELIDRINNMAFEFMQHDAMTFETAIKAAAEIVSQCAIATCEASYEDVRELWKRVCSIEKIDNAKSSADAGLARPGGE